MTQVTLTLGADDLGSNHAVASIFAKLDVTLADNIPETGPARSRMKFGLRRKKLIAASSAGVRAVLFGVNVLTRKRPFRSRLAEDTILLVGELLAPLLFCFSDFIHASSVIGI
jgi:hypothetical protein